MAAPEGAAPEAAPDVGGKGEEQGTKFSKDGDDSLMNGPVKKRGCTDIICIPIFLVHIAAFWFLSFQNAASGDPMKLISPMDFRGDFCGIAAKSQWDGGTKPDMANFGKLMWAMNVTESLDKLARDVVCNQGYSVVVSPGLRENALGQSIGPTPVNKISPDDFNAYCGSQGSAVADAKKAAEELAAEVSASIDKYTDPANAAELFTGGGSSMGTKMMSAVTKYFTMVCTKTCDLGQTAAAMRKYTYSPAPMTVWGKDNNKKAITLWSKFVAELKANNQQATLDKFIFNAWSKDTCPYENAKYCVPMPGVTFEEIGGWGMCSPKIDSGVLSKLSGEAGKSLDGLAKLSVTEDAKKGMGDVIGDILKTYDVFIIVAVCSFVVGLLTLVLMRFILCPFVWISLFLVFFIFVGGGLAILVRANQCADQSFSDAADSQSKAASASATENPFNVECAGGYSIESKDAREAAKVAGYIVLGIAALWALGVLIMVCRIRLAIAVNQVACMFLYNNPQVLLVPIIQNFVGIIWIIVWCFTATFLLSQVGENNVPKEVFGTYAEAYGTSDVAGKCTASWPPGSVYVDEANALCTGASPLCYKCGAPRFWFDYKFAYSFFSFLWHNFFFVALGQCTIAGAVGIWFFTPSGEKWKRSTVCRSVKNALFWHSGSLAFGSLILAIVVWLKWFMTWLAQQAKQTKNKVMEIVCKILAYVLWCFEKCVKFLNKNAYIQIALMGTNFCKSAKNAFFLILRNFARFGVIAVLSHIVHFIGMVLITGLTAVIGYFILQAMYPTVNPIAPTIIYVFIGWMTAKLFIGTFALAVDATLQCFIAAEEMDAGNDFAPAPLKSFLNENAGQKNKCCDACCCTIM